MGAAAECPLLDGGQRFDVFLKSLIPTSALLLLATTWLGAEQRLTIGARPATSSAPSDITVSVWVERHAEHRLLRVWVESEDYFRSSDVQLNGERSARVTLLKYRGVPAGSYRVQAELIVSGGRTVEVAATMIQVVGW
jgi:hypothetical protein